MLTEHKYNIVKGMEGGCTVFFFVPVEGCVHVSSYRCTHTHRASLWNLPRLVKFAPGISSLMIEVIIKRPLSCFIETHMCVSL